MRLWKAYIISNLLIGLLAVAVLAVIVFLLQSLLFERLEGYIFNEEEAPVDETIANVEDDAGTDDIPPFTDEIKARLEASQGFQYLVSYTDRGFEPDNLELEAGETVRLTNNSGVELRLLMADEQGRSIMPADCGSSDDCRLIERKDFWEITFDQTGEWTYTNGVERGGAGVLTITVH